MSWITTKDGKHINTDWFDKEKQIADNKKEADNRNDTRNIGQHIDDLQSFNGDKSAKIERKREFINWLDKNATHSETSVNPSEHILNITQDTPWYKNKAGTLFLLGSDKYWHKFGNDLKLYRERKIDKSEIERIKKLLGGN